MKTIILNWFGPYTFEEVLSDKESGNGLYLATGKRAYERVSKIQYCGITERGFAKRLKTHHKVNQITNDREFWLGKIEYPQNHNREILEVAEKIIVWTWQLPLNEKKKDTPSKPTTIIHFWFNREGLPRKNQLKIYKDFKDVLSWDGEYWRTGNLKVEEF
jgi:hypothetical protein